MIDKIVYSGEFRRIEKISDDGMNTPERYRVVIKMRSPRERLLHLHVSDHVLVSEVKCAQPGDKVQVAVNFYNRIIEFSKKES